MYVRVKILVKAMVNFLDSESEFLIALNLNQSEFMFYKYIFKNKVHFRHQRKILRKM
jgi:hypothetical protein